MERGWEVHLALQAGSLFEQRLGNIFPHFAFKKPRISHFWQLRHLVRYCDQQGISLIDAQSSHGHSLGWALKALRPDLKLVVHRRVDYLPHLGYGGRLKYLDGKVDRFVAISHAISEILSQLGIPPAKIATVRSAVTLPSYTAEDQKTARLELRQELGVGPQELLIANIAYLTDQKGHDTLLRGLAQLDQASTPTLSWTAFVAGDGPLMASLKALADRLNLSKVHFLGVRNDIDRLLLGSDVFAFPSNHEGLGTSLLDALGFQIPVVASRVGGIPEIILDQNTGLLVEVGDALGLAQAIGQLLADQSTARQLASNGRRYVSEQFSLKGMIDGNEAIYNQLLGL